MNFICHFGLRLRCLTGLLLFTVDMFINLFPSFPLVLIVWFNDCWLVCLRVWLVCLCFGTCTFCVFGLALWLSAY